MFLRAMALIACVGCLLVFASGFGLAQGMDPDQQGTASGNDEAVSSYSAYTQMTADMMMQQIQNRFIDKDIDARDYTVGPGDRFTILFTANEVGSIAGEITTGGQLFLKSVGMINLGHISLTDARDTISNRVRAVYSKTDFTVELTSFRVARVNVIGEVTRPGIYYAPAIWHVSELLSLAGGLTPRASLRNITIGGYEEDHTADLVRFRAFGENKDNPLICQGNIVSVPAKESGKGFVSISGQVNRPSTFEYRDDTVEDLIAFAGGINGLPEDVEIRVTADDGSERFRIDGNQKSDEIKELRAGDNVKIEWKASRTQYGFIDIFGAVERPGRYRMQEPSMSLQALLTVCGDISDRGNKDMLQIYRRSMRSLDRKILPLTSSAQESGDQKTADTRSQEHLNNVNIMSYNPRDPWDMTRITLIDGDSVYVPAKTGMISVLGAVASPGLISYQPGKDIDYYLSRAGNVGLDADERRMMVINPVTGSRIDASRAGVLFDGEILFVPQKDREKSK